MFISNSINTLGDFTLSPIFDPSAQNENIQTSQIGKRALSQLENHCSPPAKQRKIFPSTSMPLTDLQPAFLDSLVAKENQIPVSNPNQQIGGGVYPSIQFTVRQINQTQPFYDHPDGRIKIFEEDRAGESEIRKNIPEAKEEEQVFYGYAFYSNESQQAGLYREPLDIPIDELRIPYDPIANNGPCLVNNQHFTNTPEPVKPITNPQPALPLAQTPSPPMEEQKQTNSSLTPPATAKKQSSVNLSKQIQELLPVKVPLVQVKKVLQVINKGELSSNPERPAYFRKNLEPKVSKQPFGITLIQDNQALIHLNNRKKKCNDGGCKIGQGGSKKCCVGFLLVNDKVTKVADITTSIPANGNDLKELELADFFTSPHLQKRPLFRWLYYGKNNVPKQRLIYELMKGDFWQVKFQLNFSMRVKVLKGALLGLAEMHAKGYVHADFKPMNILVTPDNRGVLADFGLSLLEKESIEKGNKKTTPGLKPPEDTPLDKSWDYYAIGVALMHIFFYTNLRHEMQMQIDKLNESAKATHRVIVNLIDKLMCPLPRWNLDETIQYLNNAFPEIQP